jgi:formamidopyrimidine-DNA glycosylase
MPEAPEVQTVLSTLERNIKGLRIEDAEILYPRLIDTPDDQSFCQLLKGQSFQKFYRIGKYLGFELDDYDLIVHLRMEGKFYLMRQYPQNRKHIHAIFRLSDQSLLCYEDTRKFGRMYLYDKTADKSSLPCLKNVGLDVLDPNVTGEYFYRSIHTRKTSIKAVLLDQSILAGIGNIYADEILFRSGLDPRSRAYRISKKDADSIVYFAKKIITGAMKAGGTTIRSYTSSLGVTGRFQLQLRVHGKEDEVCPECGHIIIKTRVAQRGTYLCRNCQKRK